ncbi:hypothetical protein BDR26DRAFT_851154 [Obelidium mucronatum]|nr:hypothetical protein BDR26DRAFT_851154 [Obelidium mucronatum]
MAASGAAGILTDECSSASSSFFADSSTLSASASSTPTLNIACLHPEDSRALLQDTRRLHARDASSPKPIFRIRIAPDPSRLHVLVIVLWPVVVIAVYEAVFRLKKRWKTQAVKKALARIPMHPWGQEEERNDLCPICIEDYVRNDWIRVLPCGHDFHALCVDRWLTSIAGICPLCKKSCVPQASLQPLDDHADVFPELYNDLPHELAVNFSNDTSSTNTISAVAASSPPRIASENSDALVPGYDLLEHPEHPVSDFSGGVRKRIIGEPDHEAGPSTVNVPNMGP